jgi:uncharacterized membrane protein
MRTKAVNLWYTVRSSYWFVPMLMAFLAILLALSTLVIDMSLESAWVQSLKKLLGISPDAARLLLSTIAGAMMTVAGIVFSVTIVALTMASAQFGHRLIVNFMRDTSNQVVLGTFVATFLYCLLVLLAVSSGARSGFVPSISIVMSVVLALASAGVLIFFIHHAAEIIQAKSVIAMVNHDLHTLIHRVFPPESDGYSSPNPSGNSLENFESGGSPIAAANNGYLQAVDRDNLLKLAAEHGLILYSQYQLGKFVFQGSPLVLVWPEEKLDDHLAQKIRNSFILGDQRTYEQDVEFALDQLVEIAVRSLSPAINAPFTALMCIDRLGAALSHLTRRDFPPVHFVDEKGQLRLIEKPITFGALLNAAFNQIRQHGQANAAIIIHLLETPAVIAQRANREEDKSALLRHAMMVKRSAEENLSEELDRQDVEERYQAFLEALRQQPEKSGRVS